MNQLQQKVYTVLHTIKTARPTLQKRTSKMTADFLVSGANALFWIFLGRILMFTGLSETISMCIILLCFFVVQLYMDDVTR